MVTYNVRSLRDDRRAVARILSELRPDIACIQEAPRFLGWRLRRAALARAAGLTVVTGGASAAGNLLLAGPRVRALRTQDVRLPRRGRLHRRGIALALVELDGVRLAVAGSHFSLDPHERIAMAATVSARLAALGSALDADQVVLGADVNDVPGSAVWSALTVAFHDAQALAPSGSAATFPARAPDRRIDAIFVSTGITVAGAGVPDRLVDPARASDHLPVVADLLVPADSVS